MRKMIQRAIAFLAAVVLVAGCCGAYAEGFSLRGGVQFGMTPEEVIEIEESNGFYYDLTSKGEMLYDAGSSLQLYYQSNVGNLGTLPIMRFEYDFDTVNRRMYQFYYVFSGNNAYEYLRGALVDRYGSPDADNALMTEKYRGTGFNTHNSQSRWAIPDGDNVVVIDLWDNLYETCFLSYQSFNKQQAMDEKAALDFGL